jgi:murein DD-endopeptidase MepM/ murein hydrolase activator NlpD
MMNMHRLLSSLKHYGLLLSLVALVGIAAGIVAYLAATAGTQHDTTQVIPGSVLVTAQPPAGTPIAPFAQVDPALIPYLERGQPQYGIVPLQILGTNIPPIGAYLPHSGNTQFELPVPTATVAPRPTIAIATRAPLDTPTPRPTPAPPTPTSELVATVLAFAANVTPASLPYAGAECAPSGFPVDASILSQSFTAYHSGIDLVVPSGTPVYATQTGVVVWADWNIYGYGNLVIVQSGRFITYYAHNTSFNVQKGDVIAKGAIVSFSGSTGHSSGPHVHYETRIDDVPVDPLTFEARGYPSC